MFSVCSFCIRNELLHSSPRPEHPQRPTHRRIAQAHSGAEFGIPQLCRTSSSSSRPHNVNTHYTLDIVTSLRVVDTCAIHRALSESFQQSVQLSPAYGPGPTTIALSIHYHCVRPSIHLSHSSPPLPPSPPPKRLLLPVASSTSTLSAELLHAASEPRLLAWQVAIAK